MGRAPAKRQDRPAVHPEPLPEGARVRTTRGETGVVLDGFGATVILEMDDGSGPRQVRRRELTVVEDH